jgi:hypothetical protein
MSAGPLARGPAVLALGLLGDCFASKIWVEAP